MSRTHITTRKHGDIPGQGSHWDPYGCSEAVNDWPCLSLDEVLWRTSPNCHQRQSSGEWVLCPTQAAHWDWPWWEVCGWGGRDMRWGLSWAQGHECGRTDSAICLLWGGKGTKVRPYTHISCHHQQLGKLPIEPKLRSFTHSSILESRPCNSPGQHRRTDPGPKDTGEPALRTRAWES